MQEKPFLKEIYRLYLDHNGIKYLFVVLESNERYIGRLYDGRGLMPDFELEIDSKSTTALASFSPLNPFSECFDSVRRYLDNRDRSR